MQSQVQQSRSKSRAEAADRAARNRWMAWLLALAAAAAAMIPTTSRAQSLRGSRPSVDKMYEFATRQGMEFRGTPDEIHSDAERGRLVRLGGSWDYELTTGVGWPYVTEETRRFVEAFAAQYSAVCGMPLMITSASRPLSRQPRNANPNSVHPAGIAIDLRRPRGGACLEWTRAALLELEREGIIEATEEQRPVHFHVAVLADRGSKVKLPTLRVAGQDPEATRKKWLAVRRQYHAPLAPLAGEQEGLEDLPPSSDRRSLPASRRSAIARSLYLPEGRATLVAESRAQGAREETRGGDVELRPRGRERSRATPGKVAGEEGGGRRSRSASRPGKAEKAAQETRSYRVRPGDTPWGIARRHGLSVDSLLATNGLERAARIRPGDLLKVPARGER